MRILRSTLLTAILIVAFTWQGFGQQYYPGIPTFVPATMAELDSMEWVTMTYGSFSNPSADTGYNASSHAIITTMTEDSNACYDGVPTMWLRTMPPTDLVSGWDEDQDGPLRVLKLGNDITYELGIVSSRITYHFTPSNTENVLIIYFAFVSQDVSHHQYSENPIFHIEVLKEDDTYALTPASNSHFLINPQGSSPTPNPNAQPVLYNYCEQSNPGTQRQWCNWMPVAFDLRNYIGQNVKLRITTRDCFVFAHYGYGYFAARGASGSVSAMVDCESDSVVLTVPDGFMDYKWYCDGIRISGNTYRIERAKDISEKNFSCEATSETGATMTFYGTVNHYELDPDFEYESTTDTLAGTYNVQFTNTSQVSLLYPDSSAVQPITYVKWNFGDGSPEVESVNPLHIYTEPGNHTVTMTLYDNEKKCEEVIVKEIDIASSIPQYMLDEAVSVYPNPAQNRLHISTTTPFDQIVITDMGGKIVYQEKMNQNHVEIDISSFQTGIYFITLSNKNGVVSKKVIKQ